MDAAAAVNAYGSWDLKWSILLHPLNTDAITVESEIMEQWSPMIAPDNMEAVKM